MFILGARPLKRKTGCSESLKNECRRKKAKAKSMVPPGTQVINLANDAPVSFSTSESHNTANSISAPVAATLNPASLLTIPASSPHQEPLTSNTLSVSTTNIHVSRSPSHSSQVATPAIPARLLRRPACSNAILSASVSLSSNLPALDPGASPLMQGQQTDACHRI